MRHFCVFIGKLNVVVLVLVRLGGVLRLGVDVPGVGLLL